MLLGSEDRQADAFPHRDQQLQTASTLCMAELLSAKLFTKGILIFIRATTT